MPRSQRLLAGPNSYEEAHMLTTIDLLIFAAFLGYSIWSGLRSRSIASQNLEEYFLAGRTLPGWKAGLSMAATQFAADTPLLVTGLIATAGIFSLWRLWIYAIAFLLMGLLLGRVWRRAGVITDAELAELRYVGRSATILRGLKAIYFGVIFNCTVMAMVLFAATRIAEPFLLWNDWLPAWLFDPVVSVVRCLGLSLTLNSHDAAWATHSANNVISLFAIIAVTTLYSTTGGLRAVVDTDVVQLAVALLGTSIYAVAVVWHVGGLSALRQQLDAIYGAPRATQLLAFTPDRAADASLAVLGLLAIQWFAQMNSDGTGYLAQRSMACKSDRDALSAALVFVVTQVLLRSLLWLPIGLGLLVLLPMTSGDVLSLTAQREATYVEGIVRFLPAGARGLLLTGMLAALASTLDTHLNWGASYFANDLYKRMYCELWRKQAPSERTLVWVARGSNLLILGLSLIVLSQLKSIQSAWSASLLLGAGMGVPLLLRWLWWRISAASELAAIAASLVAAPLLLWLVQSDPLRMLIMTVLTASSAIVLTLRWPPEISKELTSFYLRVRPAGFWRPVALAVGDSPYRAIHELARGLLATVYGSICVFSLLMLLGSLMLQAPSPSWLPQRGAWLVGLALLCVVSARLGWRAVHSVSQDPSME